MPKDNDIKVLVNFPKLNETINSPEYTFRMESRLGGAVEISLNDGAWQPCRNAAGYWWYDWKCQPSGKHKIVARLRAEDGRTWATHPRHFQVGLPQPQPAPEPKPAPKGRKHARAAKA